MLKAQESASQFLREQRQILFSPRASACATVSRVFLFRLLSRWWELHNSVLSKPPRPSCSSSSQCWPCQWCRRPGASFCRPCYCTVVLGWCLPRAVYVLVLVLHTVLGWNLPSAKYFKLKSALAVLKIEGRDQDCAHSQSDA